MQTLDEICQRCAKLIHKRLRANVFEDQIVCTGCWRDLNRARKAQSTAQSIRDGGGQAEIQAEDLLPPELIPAVEADDAKQSAILDTMVGLGVANRLALIRYLKPAEREPTTRKVEPYSLMESQALDVSVRCFQTWASPGTESGFKNFRADRILEVTDAGESFEPRCRVTLETGELKPFTHRRRGRSPTAAELYLKFLQQSILDGDLTDEDLQGADEIARLLSVEQVRSAHAQLFRDLLTEITLDGLVNDAEAAYVGQVREFLSVLGWAP